MVPVVSLTFGVGSLVGITVGGRYADRHLLGNVLISLALTMIAMVALRMAAPHGAWVIPAVFLFGATAFSIASAINARIFVHAEAAPTLASAFNVSAFNVGNAVGPWLGGLVLTAGWGYLAPTWVSMGLLGLALVLAMTSWVLQGAGRASAGSPNSVSARNGPAQACRTGCLS